MASNVILSRIENKFKCYPLKANVLSTFEILNFQCKKQDNPMIREYTKFIYPKTECIMLRSRYV